MSSCGFSPHEVSLIAVVVVEDEEEEHEDEYERRSPVSSDVSSRLYVVDVVTRLARRVRLGSIATPSSSASSERVG